MGAVDLDFEGGGAEGRKLAECSFLQLLHRQTKLAFPFDPEISCSSFWFKLTVLEWTSRHDPHMTVKKYS